MHPNLYNLQPCIFARRISSSMIDGQSPRSHPYRSNHGPAISPHRRAPPLETEVACCIGYCRHCGIAKCVRRDLDFVRGPAKGETIWGAKK